MQFIYQFLLARLLPFLAGINWADFIRIVDRVAMAAQNWPKVPDLAPADETALNETRAGFVVTFIRRVVPGISTGTLNFLHELAVSWFKRMG